MRKRVILVENDGATRQKYAGMLADKGFDIETYSSKEEAISAFRSIDLPDLALLDATLHGDNNAAYDLCRELRSVSSVVPIILFTSQDNETEQSRGLHLGADDYIKKGASVDYVSIRIQTLLGRIDAIRLACEAKEQSTIS